MLTGLGISIGNIIRRILRLIREEYKGFPSDSTQETQSNIEHPMMAMMMTDKPLFSPSPSLEMLGHWHAGDSSMFNLLATPTRQAGTEIANLERSRPMPMTILTMGTLSLFYPFSDVILTIGKSRTVNEFLVTASKKKTFEVIVVETNLLRGEKVVSPELLKTGIDLTVINLASVGTVISRVTKILLGCHAILANGGLIAISGSQLIATSALYNSIPVIVVSGIYKLSPLFPSDIDLLSCPGNPSLLSKYEDDILSNVTTISPYYDYVDPSMVSLFLTNV
ncbi:beta subunit of translation initiation factor eIF2B [Mitosporidium daphniae]|uniref:Translation initiation factor eIF2B subunit beta n=1 Tax=Mitosporidium daphniae TaxID=1485682 RepID=A0A098VUE8_9MICR|nr:beta subunit of translation initiation factor eIF2B [Mitosporidium daphniae]KGG52444.1 beta subunit of translation initiation factor eIF2B [Mitosporidium daphniae]|eukprot:XP_013238880.1 beta subunit of translation initiation factor eIF2B [Mitosporidium daphniae]